MKLFGIGPKEHEWVWLPQLGTRYSYCDRCRKVKDIHGKLMTYKQALKQIEEEKKQAGMIKIRDNVYEYKNTGFFMEFKEDWWKIYRDYLSNEFSDLKFQEYEDAIKYIEGRE